MMNLWLRYSEVYFTFSSKFFRCNWCWSSSSPWPWFSRLQVDIGADGWYWCWWQNGSGDKSGENESLMMNGIQCGWCLGSNDEAANGRNGSAGQQLLFNYPGLESERYLPPAADNFHLFKPQAAPLWLPCWGQDKGRTSCPKTREWFLSTDQVHRQLPEKG